MTKFKISVSHNLQLTLINESDRKDRRGPFIREGCGCSKCGSQDQLEIRGYEDIQEVLYAAVAERKMNAGDEASWGGRTWRVEGPHVFPVLEAK